MAYYNSYFPQNYYQGSNMPYTAPNLTPNAQAQQSNQITWVQGEAAAKAFPVGSGNSVLLMDSEDSGCYIKSTDQSGMPQPLRVFDYKERTAQHTGAGVANAPVDEYVTRKEFDEFKKSLNGGEG